MSDVAKSRTVWSNGQWYGADIMNSPKRKRKPFYISGWARPFRDYSSSKTNLILVKRYRTIEEAEEAAHRWLDDLETKEAARVCRPVRERNLNE